ncbi:MAG: aminopeptidase P family protein [Chloroflexi bacterium]|nr:aminopeptidase P family protein [Chloroflexota bacterium]
MSSNLKLNKLREKLLEEGLDAMLISSSENRRYMSGFTGSAGYLMISRDDAVLATDFRYVEQAGIQAPDFRVQRTAAGLDWFPEWTAEQGVKKVGFEDTDMTVSLHQAFTKAAAEGETTNSPELVGISGVVERLRTFKDADELKLLTRAVEIADDAIDQVAPGIVPGVTEEAVAWELEKAMRERGAEMISFDTIVGAGPNGALPHHRADETVVKEGDAIVIDMGAKYRGYCSDLTRTVFVGTPDEKFREIYDIVLHAQVEAEEKVEAGMTGEQCDAISRDIIAEAGYGDDFGHSLGHGVGLAVHEFPRVGPRADDVLEDGMVFTIEPGIYLSGWGGVRIEDIVVMENGRARVISKARKLAF